MIYEFVLCIYLSAEYKKSLDGEEHIAFKPNEQTAVLMEELFNVLGRRFGRHISCAAGPYFVKTNSFFSVCKLWNSSLFATRVGWIILWYLQSLSI